MRLIGVGNKRNKKCDVHGFLRSIKKLCAAFSAAAVCFSVCFVAEPLKTASLSDTVPGRTNLTNACAEWSDFNVADETPAGLIEIVPGASIRLTAPAGIRFLMSVDAEKFRALKNGETGMILVPAKLVPAEVELTVENCGEYDATIVKTPEFAYEKDGRYYYAVVMANIPKESYSTELAVRGYLKYTNEEGASVAEYSDTIRRSAAYVAKRLIEKDDGADAYVNVNDAARKLIRGYASLKLYWTKTLSYGVDEVFETDEEGSVSATKIAIYKNENGFEIYARKVLYYFNISRNVLYKSGVKTYKVAYACEQGSFPLCLEAGSESSPVSVPLEDGESSEIWFPDENGMYMFTFDGKCTARIIFEAE